MKEIREHPGHIYRAPTKRHSEELSHKIEESNLTEARPYVNAFELSFSKHIDHIWHQAELLSHTANASF